MSTYSIESSKDREVPLRKVSLVEPILYKKEGFSSSGEPLIVIVLLGASQESAERVFTVLSTKHDLSRIKLKWWKESPPDFEGQHQGGGEWMGYNLRKGFHEIPQTNENYLHSVFMLYYSDGPDPSQLLEDIHDRGMLTTTPTDLIIPVSEYILNRHSCHHIIASEWSPLLRVKVGLRTYCAPFTVEHLGKLPTKEFYGYGRGKAKLGELGWRLK